MQFVTKNGSLIDFNIMHGNKNIAPNEGQWEDRKQWSLGIGQRRKTF